MGVRTLIEMALGSDLAHAVQVSDLLCPPFVVFTLDAVRARLGPCQSGNFIYLAVLDPTAQHNADAVRDGARQLYEKLRKRRDFILFFINDNLQVQLPDELEFTRNLVVMIEPADLALAGQPGFLTPLNVAIRRKISTNVLSPLALAPYVNTRPATGSSFFGRQRELRTLTESTGSYAVIGARKSGKTSMLREAKRRLEDEGKPVLYVDVEEAGTEHEFTKRIAWALDPSELHAAMRRGKEIGEDLLETALRRHLARVDGQLTLVLDELGVLLARLPESQWKGMAILRTLANEKGVRLIFSCFEELFLQQQLEYTGPLVNLVTSMRLLMLGPKDVHDFFVGPLQMLGYRISDVTVSAVRQVTGGHPWLLQRLGQYLMERIGEDPRLDADAVLSTAVTRDAIEVFGEQCEEIMYRCAPPLVRVVFLDLVEKTPTKMLSQRSFGQEDLDRALEENGLECTLDGLERLRASLEMHGLLTRTTEEGHRFTVVSPVFYKFVTSRGNLGKQKEKLVEEALKGSSAFAVARR